MASPLRAPVVCSSSYAKTDQKWSSTDAAGFEKYTRDQFVSVLAAMLMPLALLLKATTTELTEANW
jgi:hypothetical protein